MDNGDMGINIEEKKKEEEYIIGFPVWKPGVALMDHYAKAMQRFYN